MSLVGVDPVGPQVEERFIDLALALATCLLWDGFLQLGHNKCL